MTPFGLVRVLLAGTLLKVCGIDNETVMLGVILFVYGEVAMSSRKALKLRIEELESQLAKLDLWTDPDAGRP